MLNFLRVAVVLVALGAPAASRAQESSVPPAPAAAPAPAASPAPPALDVRADAPRLGELQGGAAETAGVEGESLLGALLRLLLVLGLVLALVWVTLNWGLRKLLRLDPARQALVKVHERVALDAKKTIYLVEAGDEFLLLGAGEREVEFLTRLDAERTRTALARKAEAPALPPASGRPFWERLLVKPPPKASGGPEGGAQTT